MAKVLVKLFGCVPKNSKIKRLLKEVQRGLKSSYAPELTLDGTGGTYYLKDQQRKRVAIFKPTDEEPYAPNNVSSDTISDFYELQLYFSPASGQL